ncbi:phage tail protein [Capnocytophaga catalasegens]|uniref:Tail fiber protein n=1 Tax=Capnocytophaga catalasegens TaxID=1004260 RepID=A0AAV5B155_9FLAO|nr:phage tail protein [Capnocytophaga catalasegens]GIZ15275.1 hypothetical protein RCZ03_12750 [Capnocytophaga catalasegens]GJM51397.1 hypothetical protein RCZ15_23700 [Capnocytophaga catalasegens]GJM54205.1 hypothetical protein RCZ16_25210 [Capnocytophaga catalasegens]
MNKINFNQTGGFPLDTDILQFMQTAYDMFNSLGELAGNLAIVKGCELTGNTVANGVVYIAGELLPFRGGTISEKIVVREEKRSLPFEDGETKEVETIRYATFGNGATTYNWADFKRINPLRELQKAVVPVGMIAMWSGQVSQIPQGWALCNGQNGTPDLRNRFVMGYNNEQTPTKSTGGANSFKLTKAQLPTEKLTGTTSSAGGHSHNYQDIYWSEFGGAIRLPNNAGSGDTDHDNMGHQISRTTDLAGAHTHTFQTENLGNGADIDNRPAYMVLAYIMFMG